MTDTQVDKHTDCRVLVPVGHQTLVLAEVTEEASVVQVHDGVLLPSDVDIDREPVVR